MEKISELSKNWMGLNFFQEIEQIIINHIPEIVVYRNFQINNKFKVSLNSALDNPIIKDFCTLTNLDIEKVKKLETGDQERVRMFDRASRRFTGNFAKIWEKDKITLRLHDGGNNINLFIYDEFDDQTPFKPEQRSEGLLWFLGFYLRLQVAGTRKNNIILVDEPGLYLHAIAQKNILSVFEILSENNTILFSTHMPYLINPDKLERIRLVIKDKKGKTTINKSISIPTEKDVLTPIITAIGMDMSGSSGIIKSKNVILEGISDYYLIKAMEAYMSKENKKIFPDNIGFIPCIGCTNTPIIASLCVGWGLDYLILVDNDKTGLKTLKELEKEGIPSNKIMKIHENEDHSIEDLFSKDDYRKIIVKIKCDDDNIKNSELAKTCEYSKPLTSLKFYDKIMEDKDKIKLDDDSKNNFNDLFSQINNKLNK